MTFKEIKQKINFRQPRYMLPAILYLPILGTGWVVCDMFATEIEDVPNKNLETTAYINDKLPGANIKGDGIGGKMNNMQNSFGWIEDSSAVQNIDQSSDKQLEDYESKYSEDELRRLNEEAQRQAELVQQANGQASGQSAREAEALKELEKALAQARLQGQVGAPSLNNNSEHENGNGQGQASLAQQAKDAAKKVEKVIEDETPTEVARKIRTSSDYFNTLAANEKEPNLIKAIIDENISAVDGSRVRLRLLDDIEIGETIVCRGQYLYATMSGFSSQRVKGTVASVMVDDEIIKINLSVYDTDGLEGLYVPSSSFRETSKDVVSGALSQNMSMNTSSGNSLSQWGMQAAQNAYQKTSNAISKAIRKNRVKLKYGTQVYLINSKNTKNNK